MTSKYGLPELPLVIWKKLENLFPLRHQKWSSDGQQNKKNLWTYLATWEGDGN